jgi:methyl-accepting chemotaxis protein
MVLSITDTLIGYILSDWLFHFAVVILILYLVYRDNKKLEIVNTKYEKLITEFLNNITKTQTTYKEEVISNIKELSISTLKVFSAIETNISEVKKVTSGVNNVTEGVLSVEKEVVKVTEGVLSVEKEVVKVAKGINEIVNFCGELELLRDEINKSTTALNKVSDTTSKFNKVLLSLEEELREMKEK